VFIIQRNWRMLCREIVAVYCGNCKGNVAATWCARSKRKSDNQCVMSVLLDEMFMSINFWFHSLRSL